MDSYYSNAEIFAWMPLTGFDKDLPDKGVSMLLERTRFKPTGVCLFLFHPDIVHQHESMETEKVLHPDNCSYYANPYNEERRRQDWTNYDVRELSRNLKENGIECFLSIMGIVLDLFHEPWVADHTETRLAGRDGLGYMNVLSRFKDGTYYEDFFIDKLCQVMEDYGFTGLHVADNICPWGGTLINGGYSVDMIEQFVDYTGFELPPELLRDREDTPENVNMRGDWIWQNCRAEWMEFLGARWEDFWKKVCDRLHSIGRKVFVLGMYCTDPFGTLYNKGVDLRRIVRAGVDYLMPNMHANTSMIARNRPWRYYEWANMMCLTDAFVNNGKKLNMLSVKDASEEWDVIHHAPTLMDRDVCFLSSYMRYTENGLKRCLDGFNICLADGLGKDEWKWLKERFDVGFGELPQKVLTPTLVWSDAAFDNTLREYIRTRRYTLHKFIYEINIAGAHTGAIVRIEHITDRCGDLFVPNFDLLAEHEKEMLCNYKGGAVIATAAVEKFNKDDYNCDFYFEDTFSSYKMCAFVLNGDIKNKNEILALLTEETEVEEPLDINNVTEVTNTLNHFMPYQKVSSGFIKAVAEMLKISFSEIIESTHPVIPMKMKDGRIRIYAMNDDLMRYASAVITVKDEIKEVKNVSKFPLLPVKFSASGVFSFTSQDYPGGLRTFRLLVPQGGISIVDVYLENSQKEVLCHISSGR